MNKNTTAKADLTAKQLDLLKRLFEAAKNVVDEHIERSIVKPFSGDVFNALKKKELVNSYGKWVWTTKQGAAVLAQPDAAVEEVVVVETPVVEKKKTKREPSGPTLDWAYRRLRRQALLFYGKGLDTEAKKSMREDLEAVSPHTYSALHEHVTRAAMYKSQSWTDFMDWFFGHEIHPGARAK